MTKKTFQILVLFFCSISGYSQDSTTILEDIKHHVKVLSSVEMNGRRAGTEGEKKAAQYIIEELKRTNIPPFQIGYKHSFEFEDISENKKQSNQDKPLRKAQNITGYIDNKKERTIVIGAHYDHLGGGFHINSRSTKSNPIHYGADDNASGVASALAIGKLINDNNKIEDFNFLIILFSAEEIGLLGSKSWLNEFKDSLDIAAMINLDMVGRMNDHSVELYGIGTSESWSKFIRSLDSNITWQSDSSGIGPSDHASFYLDSIPAIHFFTGLHEDYHKESDTYEKINYPGIEQITRTIYTSIISLSFHEGFDFKSTMSKQSKRRPSLKVTMGIMPSYISNDSGLKIDGVIDGKPAKKAKMLKGDIIIAIGEEKIKDIYDYMEVLSKYNPGDKTTVSILRKNKTETLTIQF